MQAGLLTEQIIILRRSSAAGHAGAMSDEWLEVAVKRAQIIRQNGKRALAHGEVWYPTAIMVKVRLDRSISVTDRLRYDGEEYDISAVNHDWHDNSTTIAADKVNV